MLRTFAVALAVLALAACAKDEGSPPSPGASPTSGKPEAASPPSPPTSGGTAASARPSDVIPTAKGDLRITPLHHATLLLQFGGKALYIDPISDVHYDGLPKADLVFITDIHKDHLDLGGLQAVRSPATMVVVPPAVAKELPAETPNIVVMKNGESRAVADIPVEAVPMYNLKRGPSAGTFFHDKGRGDGFVLTLGDKRVYASGDTECIPEMKALKDIDVAFVCMNLPYTMPPAEAAECVNAFKPKIVYPYHYKGSNLADFQKAIVAGSGVEVRLRDWYAP